jgi:8-oxo-dGTP pyrophosphatase MutT (NUDIX family)
MPETATPTAAPPTRMSLGSFALIARRGDDGELRWLARWNTHWNQYNFVGGHVHKDETFLQCLVRELVEELALNEGEDYVVLTPRPLRRFEYTDWSASARQQTRYILELFAVRLAPSVHYERMATRKPLCWLSRAEIEAGHCDGSGDLISDTMKRILTEVNWATPGTAPHSAAPPSGRGATDTAG